MNPHDQWMAGLVPEHDSMDVIRDSNAAIRSKHEVRPHGSYAKPEAEKTLLDVYASKGEIASVKSAHDAIAVAEKELSKILTALTAVTGQITKAQRSIARDTDRAASIALGEPVKEPPARSGLLLTDLQAQKIGLQNRAEAARAVLAECKGKFRAAMFDLVRQCAIRCAQDFYELSRQQAWCWLQMDIAQSLTGSLVDQPTWNKYLVPGSEHIEVLKRNSRAEWGQVVLMSAEGLRASAVPALGALRAHGEALFGNWPL
jgi:hypothetical protein